MEIWGGIECTINRLGNRYSDQLDLLGHYDRPADIEAIAGLGFKKIRYPVLWEKHQSAAGAKIDWTHTARALDLLRAQKIDVIAGLVHHGSGPCYVRFDDDSFAEGLAAFARETARRFPWITYYTPINEPLTTARFCGLYGHWYPHQQDDHSFLTILLSECKAIVLAMKAIRVINPDAKLLLTEDLGKTHSTKTLAYQAELENERRWLAFDLLSGRVSPGHPLWRYITDSGIQPAQLQFFRENTCVPDTMGFNYYITSERFIDENLEEYPAELRGGNGFHNYCDIEAVRTRKAGIMGPAALLREAWERYRIPLAITEAHLHCSREEQLRWLEYIRKECELLQEEGVDIRAMTVWALLGSFGWDKLLTDPPGTYEAGVFDVRSGKPRPTALWDWVDHVAQGRAYDHPVICGGGWWERDIRVLYGDQATPANDARGQECAPVLILGKSGTLGSAFARIAAHRDLHFELLDRAALDIRDPAQIERVLNEKKPWAVINAAGYVRVDDAEEEEEACMASNCHGPVMLARICARLNIKLLTFSSDLVFDGEKAAPYLEDDCPRPLNVYGRSKANAEKEILALAPESLIIRTSTFFGPWDQYHFIYHVAHTLAGGNTFSASNALRVSPTYVPDLVNVSLDLLIDGQAGIVHLANEGDISFYELAVLTADRLGLDTSLITEPDPGDPALRARRPPNTVLRSKYGPLLPGLQHALSRYFNTMHENPVLYNLLNDAR